MEITHMVDDELRKHPVKTVESNRAGSEWVRELYEMFALVRDEAAGRTENDVNADIDEAIEAVRNKRGSRCS